MFSRKPQQWNKDQKELIDLEVKEMLQKGAISKVSHQEGEFLSQIFLVGKKDGGNRPVIKLKTSTNLGLITEGRLHVQNRLKRYIFQCAAKQGVPEISKISMGRKLVRVPLSLLCTKPSTKSFYQVIKGSNVSAKAFDDSCNNIPARSIN